MDHDLFMGGRFTQAGGEPANRVARWDGSSWSSLGEGAANGVNARGYALAVDGNEIHIDGEFGLAGDEVSSGIATYLAFQDELFRDRFEQYP